MDTLHGTLDALVLKALSLGPRHGYGILRWLRDRSDDGLRLEEGSLYPALYRMERDGLIDAEWSTSELGRKAKVYRITSKGRRHLKAETRELASFIKLVTPILLTT